MDIVGTIASTIDLAKTIAGYIQAVKGAKEDRLKLYSEVSALGGLLEILHGRFDNTNTNANNDASNKLIQAGIRDSLLQCCEDLKRATGKLERIASPTETKKSFSEFLERMKDVTWPFRQEDIKTMLGRIERLKSLILLTLQTSLMEFVKETRNELKILGLDVEAIVSALEAAYKAHMKETESLLRDLVIKSQDSANGIAKIGDTITTIGRSQQDHMMKGDRMQADITVIKESQELQDLVTWLSPLDFGEKHNAISEKHTHDTGEWFLQHPKFQAWRRGDPGYETLWCPGNPGVGKSVMASLIINELGTVISNNTALMFIYFEYKTKHTVSQLAGAILKQLVQRQITQSGLESLRKHKAGIRPTSVELFDMLKIEVGIYDRVLVVIDALDEADTGVWTPLLGRLQALPNTSLLATSRDTAEVGLGLRSYQRLDIVANEDDVRKYIKGRLESSVKFRKLLGGRPNVHEEIIAGIMTKADGMFLLVQLHMNSLETKLRVADLRRALDKLPNTLDATYDEAMSRISEDHKALVYQVISWLIHAAQPMSIHDLRYALAVEDGMTALGADDLHDEAFLTSICVGLVVLREGTAGVSGRIVGLVHYTTQQYFLGNPSLSAEFDDSPDFAIACLQYLTFDIFKTDPPPDEESAKQLVEAPFASYAMSSWGVHARKHWGNKVVRGLATELLNDNQRVVTVGSLPCHTKSLSAIHLSIYFGLEDYVESLLDNGCDINAKDSHGDTAVSYAALDGQEEIMRMLLAREGVDVNPRGYRGSTPLVRAIFQEREAIVRLLLARNDLNVNLRNNFGNTPIFVAAFHGRGRIVELLLARDGVDINLQGQGGDTPLLAAVCEGHEAIVGLLLARDDLDVNRCNDTGNTPIIAAGLNKHDGIMKLLLAKDGVGVDFQGHSGCTPLLIAVDKGYEAIVRLLLAKNVNINRCDDFRTTPIFVAALRGHSGIVELLLAQDGVDVNSQDQDGDAPLSVAVGEGHEAIVGLLLARNDLDVNLHNNLGHTPIFVAALNGHRRIVELLLARDDLDVNSQDRDGDSPLSIAVSLGHETIVELLLERNDLDVNPRNNFGNTPILTAALNGHSGIVELLLARNGVDINLQNQDGNTPLLVAVHQEHEAIAKLLLARIDLGVNLRNDVGNAPIFVAAFHGHRRIVELLLARDDVDINSQDQDGDAPLSVAVDQGHEAIVGLLLARNDLDVNLRNNVGNTPILVAVFNERSGVAEILLAQDGVDINLQNRSGNTPLYVAIHQEHEEIIQLLLARADLDTSWRSGGGITYLTAAALHNNEGVAKWLLAKGNIDVNSKDSDGQGPLTLAAAQGSDTVVKLLLDQDGINVNLVDLAGNTPLDYAIRERKGRVIKLLRAAGGRANAPESTTESRDKAGGNAEEDRKGDEYGKDDKDGKDVKGREEEDGTVREDRKDDKGRKDE